MIVPNYIPEPLEVPRNVTEEKYHVRVAFIQRVTTRHLIALGGLTLAALIPWPTVSLWVTLALLIVLLIALDIWRILKRGSGLEARVSSMALPVVLVVAAWTAREAAGLGWPVAAPLAGVVAAGAYTMLSGRDFSFVGSTLLALIASSVVIAALCVHFQLEGPRATFALGANALYLLYFEYDLASLLARRRVGEEWAAVTDLFRDVFNVFGYLVRIFRHWRKHRIWDITR